MFAKRIVDMVTAAVMAITVAVPMTAQAYQIRFIKGDTGPVSDTGGCFKRVITDFIPKYLGDKKASAVDVYLSGWDLEYRTNDHHIRKVNVIIGPTNWNRETGKIAFWIDGCYYDKNADDDFHWRVWYTIVIQEEP